MDSNWNEFYIFYRQVVCLKCAVSRSWQQKWQGITVWSQMMNKWTITVRPMIQYSIGNKRQEGWVDVLSGKWVVYSFKWKVNISRSVEHLTHPSFFFSVSWVRSKWQQQQQLQGLFWMCHSAICSSHTQRTWNPKEAPCPISKAQPPYRGYRLSLVQSHSLEH